MSVGSLFSMTAGLFFMSAGSFCMSACSFCMSAGSFFISAGACFFLSAGSGVVVVAVSPRRRSKASRATDNNTS